MKIPQEKIEEIRSAIDIVDVVGLHVHLKKRGKSFTGLCPFHQEKTPSFTVSQEKQVYHCFGCGKGGNLFTFVMEIEKISFTEAVRSLAEKAGIHVVYSDVDEQQSEIEALSNVLRYAGLEFHHNLMKTEEGKEALTYFHQRQFTDDTIRTFGLGYSLQSWDSLLSRATSEGFSREQLLKAGLVRKREDGSEYDYFRGRAMFPILSTSGRIVGFGARKLREDDPLGKYINSPETPVYNKSKILYGLFHSKDAIRSEEHALLVEGYADLISLYQAGIHNVVASSGTALTEEQIQVIARYTKKLFLVYDADSAGSNATLRGMDLALAKDLDVSVVQLPEGEDPDSFIKKYSGKEFRQLQERASSMIDFKAGQFARSGAFQSPEGKAEAVRSIVKTIALIPDELKRNFFIKDVSAKYDIYESVLHRELERWIAKGKGVSSKGFLRERASITPDRSVRTTSGSSQPLDANAPIPAAERDLLKLLLEDQAEIIQFLFSHLTLSDISNAQIHSAVGMILDRLDEGNPSQFADWVQSVTDESLKTILTDIALSRYELSKKWHTENLDFGEADPWEIARGVIVTLKKQAVQKEVESNQRRMREATKKGEDVMEYVQAHQELLNILRSIEDGKLFETTK
ncbi:MAG: DNA primase [bacterium]